MKEERYGCLPPFFVLARMGRALRRAGRVSDGPPFGRIFLRSDFSSAGFFGWL